MRLFDEYNRIIEEKLHAYGIRPADKRDCTFEKELHNMLQEFLIAFGAGLTLDQALRSTLEKVNNDQTLIRLLNASTTAIEALNDYALLIDRKEVWRFVRLVNQYQITGSTTTIQAIERLHDELWQNKLLAIRKKSEVVTVQLTFLLMLSLISVIVVSITPVILFLR